MFWWVIEDSRLLFHERGETQMGTLVPCLPSQVWSHFLVLLWGLMSLFCRSPNGYHGDVVRPSSSSVTQGWGPCPAFGLEEKLIPGEGPSVTTNTVLRERVLGFLHFLTTSYFFRRIKKKCLLIEKGTRY